MGSNHVQQVKREQNYHDGTKADARAGVGIRSAPLVMTVPAAADSKDEHENNDEDDHRWIPGRMIARAQQAIPAQPRLKRGGDGTLNAARANSTNANIIRIVPSTAHLDTHHEMRFC